MEVSAVRLLGSCREHERDAGVRFHAVPVGTAKALCGARPGRRSAGWADHPSQIGTAITCPKCAKAMARH